MMGYAIMMTKKRLDGLRWFGITAVVLILVIAAIELPTPIFARLARRKRAAFCQRLVAGDGEGALQLIPLSAYGRRGLTRFLDLDWPISECADSGQPQLANSPAPGECPIMRQTVSLGTKNPIVEGDQVLDATLTFEYACKGPAQFTKVESVVARISKNTMFGETKVPVSWESFDD